ncbi:VOC family protein [Nocardia sp. NEAU-G5]|uniref:VOC family protein n=1 Tax=Nocardia albiluteola TaxID=2842303 RepID=A0ABS6B410_9NOCA|nr:VOC family protein [Nocardia albiluteola]MBU3064075.1 VOC family protein [Nocardia albiluteola]
MSELDHLVLATPRLSETVETVAHLTGLEPVEGGRHPGRGTRNFLLGLGVGLGLGHGGYLEIIGPDPDQPEPPSPRPFDVDSLAGPRLVSWAVRVQDIDAAIAAVRAQGFDPGDASEMSRTTPRGETLRWRLTAGSPTGLVPFLIDWGDSPHPSFALPRLNLLRLTAVHPDPDAISARLRAISVDVAEADDAPRTAVAVRPGIREMLSAVVEGPKGAVALF